jgi:hypothetical protein
MVLRYHHASLVVRVSYFGCVILNSQDIFVNMHHIRVTVRKSKLERFFSDISCALGGVDNCDPKLISEAFYYLIFGRHHSITKPNKHLVQMHHP